MTNTYMITHSWTTSTRKLKLETVFASERGIGKKGWEKYLTS